MNIALVSYQSKKITQSHLEEDLQPWRVAAVRVQAASVLEVPTGTIRESSTMLGDRIDILLEHPLNTEAA